MYAIFTAALNGLLGFVLKATVIKFVVFTALTAIVLGLMPLVASLVPSTSSFSGLFNAIPPSVWFFMNMFKVSFGIQILCSAYASRFIIRRLPVIG